MTTNMNFSFTRLMAVMKRDMMENWKTNLYRLIGCYTGLALALIFGMKGIERSVEYNVPGDLYVQFCDRIYSIIIFATFFYLLICASRIMEVMNTKNKRISYMMLPATISEKFVSRVIYVVIISLVIWFVALFFGELTRIALAPLFNVPEELYSFSLFDIMSVPSESRIRLNPGLYGGTFSPEFIYYLFLASNILWSHSVYILGGTYFRKNPFVKTWGIMMALFFIAAYIWINMVSRGLLSFLNLTEPDAWMNIRTTAITISIISLAFTVINWTLSYHLFRNSQITERKLFRR